MSLGHPHLPAGLPPPRWQQRIEDAKSVLRKLEEAPDAALAPPSWQTRGNFLGLCLPVEFPDEKQKVTREEINAFCNGEGFTGFGNNGSVREYFSDVSNGQLRYRTTVAPYYTAQHPRSHYTDPAVPYGQRARELVREALAFHKKNHFDFGALSTDAQKGVRATNLFYAGGVANEHSTGLWPHASTLTDGFALGDGRVVRDYQVTAIGTQLTLGTYCHENGHMLCDFPDLYEYDPERRAGCGAFCLMCFGGVADERNPTQVGAYLKYKAGWAAPLMLENGKTYLATLGGNRMFMLQRPDNPTEYLLLEYRARTGRDAALPDGGLAIWHIDELGSNASPQDAAPAHRHYECRLLQADGLDELAAGSGSGTEGDAEDLFAPTSKPLFPPGKLPTWWNGESTGLQITSIRQTSGGLEFKVA